MLFAPLFVVSDLKHPPPWLSSPPGTKNSSPIPMISPGPKLKLIPSNTASEFDIKLVVPPWFVAILKAKIESPKARRELVVKAAKVTAQQAVELGIIDLAHDTTED
ncbi:hypothetical protein K1719_026826 [Acacia pycnantha]|nr:hypothetical protein K1719_026826 [Acacia pycnantha]